MHVHARAFESDLALVAILASDASVFYEAYLQRKMALESEARADTSLELPVHVPAVSPRERDTAGGPGRYTNTGHGAGWSRRFRRR